MFKPHIPTYIVLSFRCPAVRILSVQIVRKPNPIPGRSPGEKERRAEAERFSLYYYSSQLSLIGILIRRTKSASLDCFLDLYPAIADVPRKLKSYAEELTAAENLGLQNNLQAAVLLFSRCSDPLSLRPSIFGWIKWAWEEILDLGPTQIFAELLSPAIALPPSTNQDLLIPAGIKLVRLTETCTAAQVP